MSRKSITFVEVPASDLVDRRRKAVDGDQRAIAMDLPTILSLFEHRRIFYPMSIATPESLKELLYQDRLCG